jgi:hypothetical protein
LQGQLFVVLYSQAAAVLATVIPTVAAAIIPIHLVTKIGKFLLNNTVQVAILDDCRLI